MGRATFKNQRLYRKFFDNRGNEVRLQLIAPSCLRQKILENIHVQQLCHLKSLDKNIAKLQEVAFWRHYAQDVKNYLRSCVPCEKSNGRKELRQTYISCRENASRPSEILHIDCVGPVVLAGKYRYILSLQDSYSRKIFLRPLVTQTAVEIAGHLTNLFLTYGCWQRLYSDNAQHFRSQILAELSKTFGVTRSFSLHYGPRSNRIERFHKTMANLLTKVLKNQEDWVQTLLCVEHAYNSSVLKPHQYTANELFFGRRTNNVLEHVLQNTTAEHVTQGEYMSRVTNRMKQVYSDVLSTLKRYAVNNETNYNRLRKKPVAYEEDQKILYYSSRVRPGTLAKWHQFYFEGTIKKKLNDLLYLVQPAGKTKAVLMHPDKLKPFPQDFRMKPDN